MLVSSVLFLKFRKYYTSEVCLEIKKGWILVNQDMGDGVYNTLRLTANNILTIETLSGKGYKDFYVFNSLGPLLISSMLAILRRDSFAHRYQHTNQFT